LHERFASFRLQGALEVTDEVRDFIFPARLATRGEIALFEAILNGWLLVTDGILTGHGLLLDLEPA
jgi:hypothetical protein